MKKSYYTLLFLAVFGCHHSKKEDNKHLRLPKGTIEIKDYLANVVYSPSPQSNHLLDSIEVSFESQFHNDSAKIICNHKVLYKRIISTDNRIGLADWFWINKKDQGLSDNQSIYIIINECSPIQIKDCSKYNYIRVNLQKKLIDIQVTNEKPFYK